MLLPSLSVAIACYNDGATIGALVDQTAQVAATIAPQFQVLVVDDGSQDDAREILRGLAAARPWLQCRFHDSNRGFGATFGELYRFDPCEFNAILPGDAQIHPAQLVPMATAVVGADMVLGVRGLRRDSVRRRLNSWIYNGAVSLVAGRPVHDVNSISIARSAFVRCLSLRSESAFIHAEFLLECFRQGGRVREVVIDHQPRQSGVGHGGKIGVIAPTMRELSRYVRQHGVARFRRGLM